MVTERILASAEGGNMQKVAHFSCKRESYCQSQCLGFSVLTCLCFSSLFLTAPLYVEGTCLVALDQSSWYL